MYTNAGWGGGGSLMYLRVAAAADRNTLAAPEVHGRYASEFDSNLLPSEGDLLRACFYCRINSRGWLKESIAGGDLLRAVARVQQHHRHVATGERARPDLERQCVVRSSSWSSSRCSSRSSTRRSNRRSNRRINRRSNRRSTGGAASPSSPCRGNVSSTFGGGGRAVGGGWWWARGADYCRVNNQGGIT